MTKLEYDMLTVQPMYLYPDDIEYLQQNYPQFLKDPNTPPHPDSYEIPPPITTTKKILNFMGANGWLLVRDEYRMEADRAVCEYRKAKWWPEVKDLPEYGSKEWVDAFLADHPKVKEYLDGLKEKHTQELRDAE